MRYALAPGVSDGLLAIVVGAVVVGIVVVAVEELFRRNRGE